MALPVQLFIAGPIARGLFRQIFGRVNGSQEEAIEKELLEEAIPE